MFVKKVWRLKWVWYKLWVHPRALQHLPHARRLTIGTKFSSRSSVEWCSATERSDSTALSLTTVSSTVARLSRGGWDGGYGEWV